MCELYIKLAYVTSFRATLSGVRERR